MRNLVRAWAAVVLGSAVSIGAAEAAAVSAFKETGGGVVGKLSGSLNLTGLLFGFDGSVTTGSIVPQNADLVTAPGALDVYSGLTGPLTFGAGLLTDATSTSGDAFGVLGATGLLGVPDGYVSGEALSGTTSFAGATLASLGVVPGIYVFNLPNDSVTVSFAPIPLPAGLPLLTMGLGFLALIRRRG